VSYAIIDSTLNIPFSYHGKSKKIKCIILWLKNDVHRQHLTLQLEHKRLGELEMKKHEKFLKYVIPINAGQLNIMDGKYMLTLKAFNPGLKLDKIEIETSE
jgi:hypothetical protein